VGPNRHPFSRGGGERGFEGGRGGFSLLCSGGGGGVVCIELRGTWFSS